MAVHLWKFPKEIIPELKEAYLAQNWLYLINQWNLYLVGDKLCPVCPGSVDIVIEKLKPIFLADVEVLHREGVCASHDNLVELFQKHVSSDKDPVLVSKIPTRNLARIVTFFANHDLKARGVSERRRKKILKGVFKVTRQTFSARYCDSCSS